ncbi:MAG TPA: hypothetical protein VJI13_02790 [Candidatus Norongarragalinales archaeon]|nr:hypothetical protein [Candidatus Norongarragalinales archaeon]
MKKRERILERRKIFKQELLRPLAALMYYELKVRAGRVEGGEVLTRFEAALLERLTTESNSFHDFLQSHEYAHLIKVAPLLEERHARIRKSIHELRKYYESAQEKPDLFDGLPKAINRIKGVIADFDAFEKRN